MDDPAGGLVHVTARIAGLAPERRTLRLAFERGGSFVRLEEPLLEGKTTATAGGRALKIERLDPFTWLAETEGARDLEVEYTVPLRHRDLAAVRKAHDEKEFPYLAADHGMLTTWTLFLLPRDLENPETTVEFRLPKGWPVLAPWPAAGPSKGAGAPAGTAAAAGKRVFRPPSDRALRLDLIAVGHWHVHEFRSGGFTGVVAFAPGQESLEAAAVEPIRRIVTAELKLFGRPPAGRYLFLFGRPGGRGAGGSPKTGSMTLSIQPGAAAGGSEFLYTLAAHEFHHTWTSGLFDAPGVIRWYNEGFTEYYAWLVTARLGLVAWTRFAGRIAEVLEAFENNGRREKLSLAEAGGDVFFEGGGAYRMVYDGGMLLAAWLDLAIRGRGEGKSLDDFMRALNNDPRWSREGRAPGIADFVELLGRFAGPAVADAAKRAVSEAGAFDPAKALSGLGVRIGRTREPAPADLRANLAGTELLDIDSAGTAYGLGLRSGDRLVEVNGRSVTRPGEVHAAWRAIKGGRVRVILERKNSKGETRRIVIDAPWPDRVRFQVDAGPWKAQGVVKDAAAPAEGGGEGSAAAPERETGDGDAAASAEGAGTSRRDAVPGEKKGEFVITTGLAAGPAGRYGRSAVHSDPIEYRLAVGAFDTPAAGKKAFTARDGKEVLWTPLSAGKKGWFEEKILRGGWLFATVESPAERVMILEAAGSSMILVNGEPRGGDVYGYGWARDPVLLKKGRNDFLFRVARGRLRAKLLSPRAGVALTESDILLPDIVPGEEGELLGAVRIVNATTAEQRGLAIRCRAGHGPARTTPVPVIPPLMARKVGFIMDGGGTGAAADAAKVPLNLTLTGGGEEAIREYDTLETSCRIRSPSQARRITFRSEIDGSVQYYAVTPGKTPAGEKPALFLSLHGAGVKAENQAASYTPKDWGDVAAPTNRRPYGFDWEDWGRLDALEVLALAKERFHSDPRRIYLTGHSMGGHGTWIVGVLYPDLFAAIAPSAGWYSFFSYAGKRRGGDASPIEEILARADHASDTVAMARNFSHHGVYILHGNRDDNVPVSQARFMRGLLATFHSDFAYYERPGAGHWWGSQCVDWPPLFAFLKSHVTPRNREAAAAAFVTPNPGISARSRWAVIEAQEHPLEFSRIEIVQDARKRTFSGKTENVARLALDLTQLDPGEKVSVELDGSKVAGIETPAGTKRIRLEHAGETWRPLEEPPDPSLKGPARYGTFKDAFRHRVIFVYGTEGTAEENAWSFAKARFDAETFWYRGNGSIDVIADRDFDAQAEPDRSVIVYGGAGTNRAWDSLLAKSPVLVRRGEVVIGRKKLSGKDLGCCFVRPRPGSATASVGVVAGTGPAGRRAAEANLYFVSGSGFPDLIVFGADMLEKGIGGLRAAGYFGNDWTVEHGDFAWRD